MKGQTEKKLRPFGARDKFGYFFGDVANDFTFLLSTTLMTKFYSDVMGISTGIVGTIMMIARFVDAFTDVTMGRIVDKAKPTKAGKFKPWVKRMCIPVACASFLIYAPGLSSTTAEWSNITKAMYLAITYILWGSFCYTGVNIPYGSMASAVSADPGDRASLSTFRTLGGMFAGMIVQVGMPLACYTTVMGPDGVALKALDGKRSAIFAAVMCGLAVLSYVLCYNMVTERIPYQASEQKAKQPSIGKMLGNAVKNRALLSIIVASIMMLLAQLTMQNMNAYIYPDYYVDTTAQSISSLLMMAGMLVAAAFAKPLSNKYGKAEVSAVSSVLGGLICLLMWVMKPDNVWVYAVMQMLCWLFLGIFSTVCWALITDVIDYSEIKNGVREDGSVYALYSFARKLGQALASGISGWLLVAVGYNELASQQGIPQTDAVKGGMMNIATLVPAIGFIALGIVMWLWYPLKKKVVDENNAILAEKRQNKN